MVGDSQQGEKRKKNIMSGGGAGGKPYDWRKPNRLHTLQMGDTAQEQVVFPAYEPPDGVVCQLEFAPCDLSRT